MNKTTGQKQTATQDAVAELACHFWRNEGCQPGRDLEYWLKAEQQLRVAKSPEGAQATKAAATPKGGSEKGKAPAAHRRH